MTEILLHGKYSGYSFEDVLKKDLAYCTFMKSLKFVKPHFQSFIDFLDTHLDKSLQEEKLRKVAKIMQ